MDTPFQAAPDVHVLPTSLAVPGVGVLIVNAYVVLAEQPVLIDTGIGADSPEFIDALGSVVNPSELCWVWLTHDDADHTGSIERVMALAPQARLATHGLAALRLSTWAAVPLERVHAIRPGDKVDVGDRTLHAMRPPLFDNPMTIGILDSKSGALFSADAFGALLAEPTQDARDIPAADLAAGMVSWATFDSPWTHLLDRARFAEALDEVRRLAPTRIYSSHLPPAGGSSVHGFLDLLRSVPDADPFVPPDDEAFKAIVAALAATGASAS